MSATRRRKLNRMGWALALGLAILALSQCRVVNDTLTGVNVDAAATNNHSGKNECIKQCHNDFEAAKRAEEQRHHEAVRACHSDKTCRKEEDRLHKDRQQTLQQQERDCRRNCYNEGAGFGGR